MSSEMFSQLVNALVVLFTTLITVFLIPYIKSRTTEQKYDNISFWVEKAVKAAEQIYKESEKSGAIKYNHVVTFLRNKGINIDEEELKNLIESEVLKLTS